MPAASSPPLLDELLGPLHMHFASARAAYRAYLDEGRTFLHASSLRRINLGARALLTGKGWLLPDAMQVHARALIEHYDIWLTLWEAHAERARPALADPFAFENSFTYPRDAEQALESLYQELRASVG